MRQVFSYIRFSTRTQAKGSSKERQWNVAREYADKHGYELVESTYADLGVSAYKSVHRTGLQNMLDAIDSGSIPKGSIICIEHVDRLSRKQYQTTNTMIQEIVNKGVELYVDADNMHYNQSTVNDIDKIMMLAIRCKIAFEESEQKSIRIKASKVKKKSDGLKGVKTKKVCPKWLTFNEQTNDFEFNEYADCIRYLIKLKQAGGTENTITKDMQASPYSPPRAKEWNPTSIRKILSQPALYGGWQTQKKVDGKWVNDELILNHYPALITFEEYQLLTPKKRIKGKNSPDNHFRGLTRCAKCNSVMTKKKDKINGKVYIAYRCNNAAKRLGCNAQRIEANQLERLIRAYSRFLKITTRNDSETNAIKQQLQAKQQSYEQITNALTTGGDVTALITAATALDAEIKDLKSQLVETDATQENVLKLSTTWDNPNQWNELMHRFVKTIWVDVEGIPRKKKYIKILIQQHDGHLIESKVFGSGSKFEWCDIRNWI